MKFLQISDLHYCPEKDGRTSREIREELPVYIQKNNLQADELFVTGDYRHAKLQKDEPVEEVAQKVVALILQIAQAAGITDKKHIHIIPGNHDRSRNSQPEVTERLGRIKEAYSSKAGMFEKDDLIFLKEQFAFFQTVCQQLYGDDNPWSKNPLHTYTVLEDAVVLYLNTAIMHNRNEDRGCLIIGNDELARLLKEISNNYPQLPIIILAHHSLEFFERSEREAVEQILRSYPVLLYLCGDAHQVWWRKINDYTEITMGCIKSNEGTQATFLYGDTAKETYSAHNWDGTFGAATGWSPYEQFNNSLRQKEICLTHEIIQADQKLLKNELILPWMKKSASFQAVFPEMFIHPSLTGKKVPGSISYSELIQQYKSKSISIIGDAGFGKSTLMRYIYLFDNSNLDFLYLKATALRNPENLMSEYEKGVRALLTGRTKSSDPKTILIDGMDEAFVGSSEELQKAIIEVERRPGNITVWFGWRTENYYEQETTTLQRMLDNVISIDAWKNEMVEKYVGNYAQQMQKPELSKQFMDVAKDNETVISFSQIPFQLTLLLYLLDNEELANKKWTQLESPNATVYDLYSQFFLCWLKKERHRVTSSLPEDDVKAELYRIAKELYYGNYCVTEHTDTAITDLLVSSNVANQTKKGKVYKGFYHRSLCAFFYAKGLFDTMRTGGKLLIEELRQPLKNDVTDFVRGAIETIQSKEILRELQHNLMLIYRRAAHPRKLFCMTDMQKRIAKLSEEERFYLKNELVYLITRLPSLEAGVERFVKHAYKCEKDPYMKLDLAYGAVLTGPSRVALDYAKSLIPGSESDLVNRSWTVAYFGDVQANPYHYRDEENCSWTKAREARLKRFQSSNRKAVRFRILDFPLMYCFYESRKWNDINAEDLKIIENASIDNPEYSVEEKCFLQEQKQKLVSEYKKRLHTTTEKR